MSKFENDLLVTACKEMEKDIPEIDTCNNVSDLLLYLTVDEILDYYVGYNGGISMTGYRNFKRLMESFYIIIEKREDEMNLY